MRYPVNHCSRFTKRHRKQVSLFFYPQPWWLNQTFDFDRRSSRSKHVNLSFQVNKQLQHWATAEIFIGYKYARGSEESKHRLIIVIIKNFKISRYLMIPIVFGFQDLLQVQNFPNYLKSWFGYNIGNGGNIQAPEILVLDWQAWVLTLLLIIKTVQWVLLTFYPQPRQCLKTDSF